MRSRSVSTLALGVLGSLVLLLVFSGAMWAGAWGGAQTRFELRDWSSPSGQVAPDGDAVRIVAEASAAVAEHPGPAVPAQTFRYLHYRIDDVARDARVIALWRDADGAAQRPLLPRVAGRGSIDLSQSDGWQGNIAALTFVALPIDYLPGDAVGEQAMRLDTVELRSDNAWSALTTTLTDWLAPRPWSGASINTAGSEFGQRGASLTAFVACLVLWWLLVWRVVRGRDATQRAWLWIVGAGVLLLVLDQGIDLVDRTLAARSAQTRAGTQALPLAADPGLARDVAALRATLAPDDRLVVHGAPPFQRDYVVYLLRDFDVGALFDFSGFSTRATLNGMVLVVAGGDDVVFDEATSSLQLADQIRPATPLWQGDRLRAYRLGSAGEAR